MKKINEQDKILEDILSLIRAAASQDEIEIEFSAVENNFFAWSDNLVKNDKKISLPLIDKEANFLKQLRVSSDMALCYYLYNKKEILQQFLQEFSGEISFEEKEIFDAFEKIRVLDNIKNSYKGSVINILQKIESDIELDASNNIYAKGLSLILLNQIFGDQVKLKTKNFAQNFAKTIDKKLIKKIENLSKKTANNYDFFLEIKDILQLLKQQNQGSDSNEKKQEQVEKENKKQQDDLINNNEENIAKENENSNNDSQSSDEKKDQSKIDENQQSIEGVGQNIDIRTNQLSDISDKIEFKKNYKIFSNKYDEVVLPQKLLNKNELELLRYGLELRLGKLLEVSKKLSIKLKKKLIAKKDYHIEPSDSSGTINRRKFTQLIVDPFLQDLYISEKKREYQDTIVTILIDNSGSMRGQPIIMAALACETIAQILEKFSIKTEILGFTTADWKGGRSRKLWEAQGRNSNPGRLNDLRHIIYKSADQNFKKAKVNLGFMIKEGVLKENIDGEALLWAKGRLMQRDEKRKILMVISDGTPVDDSTQSANDNEILVDHLHHVINRIEKQTEIEIVAVGIGHQVNDFYKNSIAIKGVEDLGDVMIEKIANLL